MGATEARKSSPVQAAYDIADEDDMYVSRSHSSARRYKQPVQHDTLDDPLMLRGAIIQQHRSSLIQPAGRSLAPKALSRPLRRVEIIELPGGDASHAHIYQGPVLYGPGQDLTPITSEVRDVNGDGKPDVIIHIQDQQLILINDGSQFRPQQAADHVNI